MGDGSRPDESFFGKLLGSGKRILTGESVFMTHFMNTASGKRSVAFAAPYPGKIIPVDMSKIPGQLICQKDAFLCAAKGTELGIAFAKRLGVGFFGGEGFILQRIRGDGMVFVQAGGTVVQKKLAGETLRVDTGCLVAFSAGIDYDIERAVPRNRCFSAARDSFWQHFGERARSFSRAFPFPAWPTAFWPTRQMSGVRKRRRESSGRFQRVSRRRPIGPN